MNWEREVSDSFTVLAASQLTLWRIAEWGFWRALNAASAVACLWLLVGLVAAAFRHVIRKRATQDT